MAGYRRSRRRCDERGEEPYQSGEKDRSTLTKEEKEERQREAVKEREKIRQEMVRKRQEGW